MTSDVRGESPNGVEGVASSGARSGVSRGAGGVVPRGASRRARRLGVATVAMGLLLSVAACGKSEQKSAGTGKVGGGAPAADSGKNAGTTESGGAAGASTNAPAPTAATSGGAAGNEAQPAGKIAGVKLPAGWYAVYSGPGVSGNAEVRTHSPYAAFALDGASAIDPSLKSSGWSAAYSGLVDVEEPGTYRFLAEFEGGQATLTVFDKDANELGKGAVSRPGRVESPWLTLKSGKIQVTVRFTQGAPGSPAPTAGGAGGARLRTMWEMQRQGPGSGFAAEGIPTSIVGAPKFGEQFALAGYAARQGRLMLGESGCLHCHAADTSHGAGGGGGGGGGGGHDHASHGSLTAVLNHQGPLLGEIGRRANPSWLLRWITDPHAMRPGTSMPDVIGDSEKDKADAEAIVHFLVAPYHDASEWTGVKSEAVATEAGVLAEGRELYHTVGCIQCHGAIESPQAVFGETGMSTEVPKVDVPLEHGDLAGKWKPSELSAFLKDPLKTRPSGRMPSLNLTDEEADLLATYLTRAWSVAGRSAAESGGNSAASTAFAVDPAKVEIGKAAFAARGCANCHEMGPNTTPIASTLKAPALAALTGAAGSKGCLDPASATTPRYQLGDAERAMLRAGIDSALKATGVPAPLDAEARTVAALNCRACHAKDGQGGAPSALRTYFRTVVEIDLGDEGRVPPHLNQVGWKLTTPWLRSVLTEAGRARPYMATRMPQFGAAHVGSLSESLASVSGVWPDSDVEDPASNDDIIVTGRQLVGDTGLNCISCHAFASLPPAGAPGPNIADFAERLRLDWWRNYALGPARQKPGTRMPAFFATGKSVKTDVLDGDPSKQIDAMWAYFNLSSFAPPPSGVQTGKGFSLPIGDRPRIFRTFMKDAGSRGIAVGYPSGVHFGFDATAVRLVDAWKGDFIDASGAWANRGGNVATGQGASFWKAPVGPAVVIAPDRPASWPAATVTAVTPDDRIRFDGYRLDGAGVPTFLYRVGSVRVEETATPAMGAVRRAFKFFGVPAGRKVYIAVGAGTVEIGGVLNATPEWPVSIGEVRALTLSPIGGGEAPIEAVVMIKP